MPITVVFVHGAWHCPEFFDKVRPKLEVVGYKTVALLMPSVSQTPLVTSLEEDIETIRSAVVKELDGGNDVVIHAHSWGGIPANSALDGLSRQERPGESAVVKLTFVSSFVIPEGVSLEMACGGKLADWLTVENETTFPDTPIDTFYADVDPQEAKQWSKKIKHHPCATFTDVCRSAAWKKIPVAYLVCENDQAIPVQAQDAMIAGVREAGVDVEVERIASSHSPHLSQPNAVVAFIRRAIEG